MRKKIDFDTFTFSAPAELIRAIDTEVEQGQRSRFVRQAIEARLRERQRSRARRAVNSEQEVA